MRAQIFGTKDVAKIAAYLCTIANCVAEDEDISEEDRMFFRDFMENHFGEVAFASADEIRKKNEESRKEIGAVKKLLKRLIEHFGEDS